MLQKRLDAYFDELIKTRRIPGCGLIVRKNRAEVYHAYIK